LAATQERKIRDVAFLSIKRRLAWGGKGLKGPDLWKRGQQYIERENVSGIERKRRSYLRDRKKRLAQEDRNWRATGKWRLKAP